MARGGARKGAGRPKNVPNKPSAERERRLAESGILPLDVMIDNMRVAYENALKSEHQLKDIQIDPEDHEGAFKMILNAVRQIVGFRKIAQECARDAAVFVHPRLAQVEHKGEIAHYVARVPSVSETVDQWQEQHTPERTIQ